MRRRHLNSIPGAKAIGYLAMSPINNEPTNAANAVATNIAPWSIFISLEIPLTPAKLKT